MNRNRIFAFVGIVLVSTFARAATPVSNVRLRVEALAALYDLDATDEQLRLMHRMSRGAAANAAVEKLPDAYRSALMATLAAFEKDDDKATDAALEKLDKVREDLKIEDESEITPTDAARERAERLLKQFTAGQIAAYMSDRWDQVASPAEVLIDTMEDLRAQTGKDYEALRDRAAKQAAVLYAGLDPKVTKEPADKFAAFLTKVHDLSAADFTAKRADLEAEAKRIAGQPDPMPAIRHWAMNSLAQLLSNPGIARSD